MATGILNESVNGQNAIFDLVRLNLKDFLGVRQNHHFNTPQPSDHVVSSPAVGSGDDCGGDH